MTRETITKSGEDAALRIPSEILDKLGLTVGDEVELVLVERTLVILPLSGPDREARIEAVIDHVVERRRSAYEELAKGAE
jgi:antitoxin component of MazEF toxin-antitoxin module